LVRALVKCPVQFNLTTAIVIVLVTIASKVNIGHFYNYSIRLFSYTILKVNSC
jgi:hypothetical protein